MKPQLGRVTPRKDATPEERAAVMAQLWARIKTDKDFGLGALIARHPEIPLATIADNIHAGLVECALTQRLQSEIDALIHDKGRPVIGPLNDAQARSFVGKVIRGTNTALMAVYETKVDVSRDALDPRPSYLTEIEHRGVTTAAPATPSQSPPH